MRNFSQEIEAKKVEIQQHYVEMVSLRSIFMENSVGPLAKLLYETASDFVEKEEKTSNSLSDQQLGALKREVQALLDSLPLLLEEAFGADGLWWHTQDPPPKLDRYDREAPWMYSPESGARHALGRGMDLVRDRLGALLKSYGFFAVRDKYQTGLFPFHLEWPLEMRKNLDAYHLKQGKAWHAMEELRFIEKAAAQFQAKTRWGDV